jgi:hypothetical protein
MIYDLYTKQWEEDAVALFAMSKVSNKLYDAMELSMSEVQSEGSLPAEVMKAVNMYIVKHTKIFNETCLSADETSLFFDEANTVDDAPISTIFTTGEWPYLRTQACYRQKWGTKRSARQWSFRQYVIRTSNSTTATIRTKGGYFPRTVGYFPTKKMETIDLETVVSFFIPSRVVHLVD